MTEGHIDPDRHAHAQGDGYQLVHRQTVNQLQFAIGARFLQAFEGILRQGNIMGGYPDTPGVAGEPLNDLQEAATRVSVWRLRVLILSLHDPDIELQFVDKIRITETAAPAPRQSTANVVEWWFCELLDKRENSPRMFRLDGIEVHGNTGLPASV